jgi:hypothetical protein
MKHSAALSVIVFGAGYLTGIALVCEPQIYLKLAGVSVMASDLWQSMKLLFARAKDIKDDINKIK